LKAKREIEEHPEWNATVIYGDTDSLFIRLPGRTVAEAVRLGKEMAEYVSSRCPEPVKLRYEKVYCPCVLLAKKRYYGLKFETGSASEEGKFDAKGIETVRRDSCPLVSKTLQESSM
jgi:DNA polymerase zeta